MPVKPQVRRTVAVAEPFWGSMSEEDEARSLIGAVDRSLADCIKLLEEVRFRRVKPFSVLGGLRIIGFAGFDPVLSSHPQGFPTDQVREVLSRLPPVSRKFAKYWICRARLMERDGHLDVLPVFEEAVGVVLEVSHPHLDIYRLGTAVTDSLTTHHLITKSFLKTCCEAIRHFAILYMKCFYRDVKVFFGQH